MHLKNKLLPFLNLIGVLYSFAISQELLEMQSTGILKKYALEFERAGRFDLAAEYYMKLCQRNMQDLDNYLGVKRCLLHTKDYNKLVDFILNLQRKKRTVRFEIDLAEAEYLQGHKERAVQDWLTTVENNAHDADVYELAGAVLKEHQKYEEAVNIYKKARKEFKDPYRYVFELADIYFAQAKYENGLAEYLNYLQRNTDQIGPIQSKLFVWMKKDEAQEKILHTLEKEFKKHPTISLQMRQILGSLYMQTGEYATAFEHYKVLEGELRSDKRAVRGQYLYSLGLSAAKSGAFLEARKSFEFLINTNDNMTLVCQAEFALAQISEQEKNFIGAISAYKKYLKLYPQSAEALKAMLKIGDILFYQLFQISDAEEAYTKIFQSQKSGPYRYQAILRLGECAIAKGKMTEAKEYFSLISKEVPAQNEYNRLALLFCASLEFYNQRPRAALGYLKRLLPGKQEQLASSSDKLINDALELFLMIQNNNVDSVSLAVMGRAKLLLMQRKYSEGIALLEDYINKPHDLVHNEDMKLLMVEFSRKTKKFNQALQECNELLNDEITLYKDYILKMMAEIYEYDLCDQQQAKQYYELLLLQYPNSIYLDEIRIHVRGMEKIKK